MMRTTIMSRESSPLLDSGGIRQRFRHQNPEPSEPVTLPFNNSGAQYDHLPVYYTIHRIRNEVTNLIDDPYSLKQLRDPRMNQSLIRPLVDKYYEMKDISVVFCLLVNRMQFQSEQSQQLHEQSVNLTRSILCELVATRILRRFYEDSSGPEGLLLLANVLVAGFSVFQGAPENIQQANLPRNHWTVTYKSRHPALEIAIVSQSKLFLSSGACQLVVNAIYIGRIVYTPTTFVDIIPDNYKYRPISLYDPRKAPFLNQYRLMVPRTRNTIEICQFICLLCLYLWIMIQRPPPHKYPLQEIVFSVYACGWILEQFSTILEHGWFVYTQNLWSFLDVTFSLIFAIYGVLRLHGLRTDSPVPGQQALDVLAMAATILIPRLAFNLMSENMLFVSLRAMMSDFMMLTVLAVWCFIGFLLSMLWLGEGKHHMATISKWMLWVWFGLDGTGIGRSVEFHWLLGPILMVTFAFLGYLFLVILVSMLSNTFSGLHSDVDSEIQFRRAVLTLEGVKSDAIFSYLPPLNIFAIVFLVPLRFVVTERWFHKINVAIIRTLNLPILVLVAVIERQAWWAPRKKGKLPPGLKARGKGRPGMGNRAISVPGFNAHGNIQAVFRAEYERIKQEEMDAEVGEVPPEVLNGDDVESFMMGAGGRSSDRRTSRDMMRRLTRRDSSMPLGEVADQLRALLSTADGESETGGGVGQRIHALEDRLKNIEEMLETLVRGKEKKKVEEEAIEDADE
ncbi:hypothetical protein TWF106_009607 [Orbilia oligospora]|uniref:Ion transport domain-containing protein n=1 Tax=Orbilia oligospora TaxID=2813651 RepID=A0A7C8K508_ORBOL|nr:hypothetical protein TWF788_001286 [Orbilia oligospora]KAF3205195.1 hypothetical protein TWF679_009418 [Orbilia oligospora]KAF3213031.1 hypothetical protein TWF106_009607 [Orbilia oligospora]